jgi:biopolymer transport protein ExbD
VADRSALLGFIKEAAVRKPQPEIHIRGDKEARYEAIGRVMYAIQRGGVQKVGFLTEPDRGVPVYR